MNHINKILKAVLLESEPSEEDTQEIKKSLNEIKSGIEKALKSKRIDAEVFVGGSFAKGTLIKKNEYDIDLFLRFDKRHKLQNFSDLTQTCLRQFRGFKVQRIHGSRDYFRISVKKGLYFEVVPVLKIKNPREAENITDLSYSHVKYINKRLKTEKIKDEIRLAKAFCHAQKVYGAESYIQGFSGYGLELLVYKYKSFLNMIKQLSKIKPEKKVVIDIEKLHKNKNVVLLDLNAAKLQSPIVLVDPTYKQRNALAALSNETFEKFQKAARAFLAKPSLDFFRKKEIDFEKLEKEAKKKGQQAAIIEIKTGKQRGDVAGSKLIKFYKHLSSEIGKEFNVKKSEFEYKGGEEAMAFFSAKAEKQKLIPGPDIKDIKNVKRFKEKHKKTNLKGRKIYAKENPEKSLKDFLGKWKLINRGKMKDMGIIRLELGLS